MLVRDLGPIRTEEPFTCQVLKAHRLLYSHYGVRLAPDLVVELTGDRAKDISTASVRLSSLRDFVGASKVEVVFRARPEDEPAIWERALAEVGKPGYSLLWGNCEHLAWYVAKGVRMSTQVNVVGWTAALVFLGHVFLSDTDSENEMRSER